MTTIKAGAAAMAAPRKAVAMALKVRARRCANPRAVRARPRRPTLHRSTQQSKAPSRRRDRGEKAASGGRVPRCVMYAHRCASMCASAL